MDNPTTLYKWMKFKIYQLFVQIIIYNEITTAVNYMNT